MLRVQHCAVANDQIEARTAGDAFESLRHGPAWSRLKGLAEAHGAFARIELTHFPDAHVTHGLPLPVRPASNPVQPLRRMKFSHPDGLCRLMSSARPCASSARPPCDRAALPHSRV